MRRWAWKKLPRRLLAAALAVGLTAGTLWAVAVCAGSETVSAAWLALRSSAAGPLAALRWELGDLVFQDGLSYAAAMAIGESPLLLSAREAVLRSVEPPESPREPARLDPVEEEPVELPEAPRESEEGDNGVPARTLVPTAENGYTVSGRVYISNSTEHELSVQELTAPFDAALTEDEPQFLILHTHGSEAYTPAPGTEVEYSGNLRTTDNRYNVVHVGDVMAQELAEAGISVLHDRTLYDYPSYSGAYDRALSAIESYLVQYPSIRFVLDVHRDAIEDTEGNEYKVITPIEGMDPCAQITLVVGSDGSGLEHPHWMENLKLAVALQQNLLQTYPTFARPILLRNSRYNQHATTGSLLIEVGAAGNSPEEAALAGKLLARQLAALLQNTVQ